jgi:TRAP-type C4-dicarboxylate transport system permease small subunit
MSAPGTAWERRFDAALGFAAAVILFSMMTITFIDVIGRYGFRSPMRGAFEITELMLLVLIFAGLPLVSHADEHVTMDFIDHLFGPRGRRAVISIAHMVVAVTLLGLSWLIWIKAGKIAAYGDTTEVLRITVGPFVYFMAAMIALSGLIHAWKVFNPGEPASTSGVPTT